MAKCSKCAASVPDESQFCGVCGEAMQVGSTTIPGEPAAGVLRVDHTIDEPGDGTPAELPLEDTSTLPVGTVIDRKYVIVRVLGRGGMGVIYLARDVHTDHEVVLKAVRRELAHRPDLRARMLAEGRALAHIDHANVVRLNAVIAQGDDFWLVMQYIDGETLDKIVSSHKPQGGMPVVTALGLFRQIVAGVGAAHKEGVIHRDLKPANVIVRKKDGVAKVMDFGIAKLPNKPDGAITKGVIGSLWYMAPEQVKGRRDLDARVDVYALGILLYQMVVGRVPFNGASEYEIMKLQAEAPMPLARVSRPDVSTDLDAIIQRATQKDRDRRFPSCDELLAALDAIAAALGVAARPLDLARSAEASGAHPRVSPDLHPPAPPAPTTPDPGDVVPIDPGRARASAAISAPRAVTVTGETAAPDASSKPAGAGTVVAPPPDAAAPKVADAASQGSPPTPAAVVPPPLPAALPANEPATASADVSVTGPRAAPNLGNAAEAAKPKDAGAVSVVEAQAPREEANDVTTPGAAVAPAASAAGRRATWIFVPVLVMLLGGGAAAAVVTGVAPNPFVDPPKRARPIPAMTVPPPAPPPVASSAAAKTNGPLEALAGSWVGNGRELDAVVDGDVLEFRVKTPAQFAPQDYAAGEARFALRTTDEPNVFRVEDRIRPNPPPGKTYDVRSRGTCQEAWSEANGEPLNARFDGKHLTVDFAKIEPTEANFVVEGAKITSCVALRSLKAAKVVSVLTRN